MFFLSRLSHMEMNIQMASTTIQARREISAILTAWLIGRKVDSNKLNTDSRTPSPAGVKKTTNPTVQARAKSAAVPAQESVYNCELTARLSSREGIPIANQKIKPAKNAPGSHLILVG